MVMHIEGVRPVKVNGKWELEDYEYDKEFTDDQVRECDLCTVCGFSSYPTCKEWCNKWKPYVKES